MTIFKKISCFMIALVFIANILSSSSISYAAENYPLEVGEKLVDSRIVDNDRTEIFTQCNNCFYLKKLQRIQGRWIMVSSQIIRPKGTGLITQETEKQGDRQLAGVLQKELRGYGIETTQLPSVVDYSQSEFLPPVGEQKEESCVGWSTGYYLRTYQQARDIGWKVKDSGSAIISHVFSPTFIYNQINKGEDNGAMISEAADLLKNIGDATLEQFPYVPGDYLTQPDPSVVQSAYPHRIREWRLLYTERDPDDYIIQKTKEYLNTGDLVVAGSRFGYKFVAPYINQNGKSIITCESYLPFKHAYDIVGYDDNFVTFDGLGAFKLINSWGIGWGELGFSYISYKAFAANAIEGYVFTDIVNRMQEVPKINMNDAVTFTLDFSGTGRFDIKIKDKDDKLIYAENNLQGKDGVNTITWNGMDQAGNKAEEGVYTLSIIPYKNDRPKDPFNLSFIKAGKIQSANYSAYIYDNTK